jgi:hypothetical protein
MTSKRFAAKVVLGVTLGFALAFAWVYAQGSTTSPRPNALGLEQTYENHYSYLIGLPRDGQVLDGKYTNIRWWPLGAPELFDQSILFCGDVTEKFEGKQGVLAIAYETRGYTTYRGLACHKLLGVSELRTGGN